MSELIDDLLAFSRVGRQPIRETAISPAEIVRLALEELRNEVEGRQGEISIGDMPPRQADPVLLRQVYVTLVGNALKFTGKQTVAQLVVGFQEVDTSTVYRVKDNGAGFDMRDADKLVGVFQRLHRIEDFPGTRVGLAIVHRIITRHGGRVWAEGEVDRGATCYFTLRGIDD